MKGRRLPPAHPAHPAHPAQLDWLSLPDSAAAWPAPEVLRWLQAAADAGWLRRLDAAMAVQLHRLDPEAGAPLLVAAAALAHVEGRGHTCLPLSALCVAAGAGLGWPAAAQAAAQALWPALPGEPMAWQAALCAHPRLVRTVDAPDQGQALVLGGPPQAPLLYWRRYAAYEQRVGQGLWARARQALPVPEAQARLWLDRFFAPREGLDWQKIACAVALRARLSVLTGGPGTGKTYTAARLLALLLALHTGEAPLRVALAAPTGKAAARLKQSIDEALLALPVPADAGLDLSALVARMGSARTLHSLLGARPDTRAWRHHAGAPLALDVLIVDEASMVHLEMMDALLQALPPHARLVLLGDKDQLASVEAGAVLGELCRDAARGAYAAETVAYLRAVAGQDLPPALWAEGPALAQQTVMLRESRRFGGPIGRLALAVNAGDALAARAALDEEAPRAAQAVLRALQPASPEAVSALACGRGQGGAPSYADYLAVLQAGPVGEGEAAHADWVRAVLQAFERFRLLCAVRQGPWGAEGLNSAVQQALAGQGLRAQGEWYAGRPVMVTRNDSQLGVFNGDVGIALPGVQGGLRVWFHDGAALRSVSVMRLAHAETAFAMTVHKSQGSEFAHTVLVLPPGGGELLTRELVYTGLTRSRERFTLVEAEAGLLEAAVARPSVRASGLAQWW